MRAYDEGCDDSNALAGDGCSSSCFIETHGSCDITVNPNLCDLCGNGKRKYLETCDDGIQGDGEGCASDCMSTLSTWTCSGGTSLLPDNCFPICGDGV